MGKWSRRTFITSGIIAGGALVVGVALRPGHRTPKLAKLVTNNDEILISSWVKIDPTNKVTAIVAHSEMGQGAHTALTQMLADEIDAKWEDVAYMEAPAEDEYANWALGKGFLAGDIDLPKILVPTLDGAFMQITKALKLQVTGGSLSIRATGVSGVRVAGAAARQLLLKAAAVTWSVPIADLDAVDTHIINRKTGQRAPFAEFAAIAAKFTPSASPKLKASKDFKVMGKDHPRFDIPSKVDGSAQFSIDAQVPNMQYAAVLAAPVFGASVESLDSSAAQAMPSVHSVVNLQTAVAVVADSYWQANRALQQVVVKWSTTGNESLSSETIYQDFDSALSSAWDSSETTIDIDTGNIKSAYKNAKTVIDASYTVPFLAHACMEPLNATAQVTDQGCEVWVGTQNPLQCRYDVAEAIAMDVDKVTLHQHYMGGGFGRRSSSDYAVQAALIAKQVPFPVKLIWSREEDIRQDQYRPANISKFRAMLDADNQLIGWDNIYNNKHEPVEAPIIPYAVASKKIHHLETPTHIPFGPWRSVDHSQHGFFTESFIDEVAVAAQQDPLQMRLDLLADHPRYKKVLTLAASKAGWGKNLPKGSGMGLSLQKAFGTLVAQVVEVSVSNDTIKVNRVTCAVDPGFAVSPNGLIAQMESAIIFGLSAALYGDIQIEQGAVKQSNFHDYKIVRMNEAPIIDTYIINSGERWGGAGEPATPGIAPALTNAIFAASGRRIRQLPIS